MINPPFKAYPGKEPYVFISYAHKDSDAVFKMIDDLHGKGVRIWYDEGIEVGEKWAQKIASRLRKSAVMIACISPNMTASQNCEREIYYAVKHKIPILPVFLDKVIELPEGLDMQLEITQFVTHSDYINSEAFYNAVRKALENCNSSVFDFAHTMKPLVLGGHDLPEVFLRRNEVFEELQNFMTGARNKLLLLRDVSGAGKSTTLLKYIEERYNWDVHGELIYFSFEYEPYFTKFLYLLGEKYFQEDMASLTVDDIASKLLKHWEHKKCTIIFDAVERLFTQPEDGGEPEVTDSRFLIFINDLAALKDCRMVLSTKLNIDLFDSYPYLTKMHLQGITMPDFLEYLENYGLQLDEFEDWDYLKDILASSMNNMAIIQMFAMFAKEYGRGSISNIRENSLLDSTGDIRFEDRLFQYYWSKFSSSEQDFLKILAVFRREISVQSLMQMIPATLNKLELMKKIHNYLFANKSADPIDGETLSIHDIFKKAISAHTTPEEQKAAHIQASDAFKYEDTSHELHYLEKRTEQIYHIIMGGDTAKGILLMLSNQEPLSNSFIDLVYYHSQFPVCIELISMALRSLSMEDPHYITLNRKIGMSLDKNGGTITSLTYFENYIQASFREKSYPDYIKGMYYKSEPVCRLGRYSEAESLILFAEQEAKKYNVWNDRANTNFLGRLALYRMKKGELAKAKENIEEALRICDADEYSFDDKNVIRCWWRLIYAKIMMHFEEYSRAEALLDESLAFAVQNGYVDFEAECYMEKGALGILTGSDAADSIEKAIALSSDNLYLLIRLRLIKTYYEMLQRPHSTAILTAVQSSRILLKGTGYEDLETLGSIIMFYAQAYQNHYEIEDMQLPKFAVNSTTERLISQVKDVSQKLREISDAVSLNTQSIKELI